MIVVDASVLIAHLDGTDAHHDQATQLLIDANDEILGVSPLTLSEVLVGPARAGKLDAAQAAIKEPGIATIALSERASARLAALRVNTRLRLPDCCVLLAAETADGEVATFDERLASSAAALGLTLRRSAA